MLGLTPSVGLPDSEKLQTVFWTTVRPASLAAEEERVKMNSPKILMFHTRTTLEGKGFDSSLCLFRGLFALPGQDLCGVLSLAVCGFSINQFKLLSWIFFCFWSNYRLMSNSKNPSLRLWGRTMWSWSKTSSKSWARSLTAARLPTSLYAYWRSLTSRSELIVARRRVRVVFDDLLT